MREIRMDHLSRRSVLAGGATAVAAALAASPALSQERTLLNVSYDPTREFYRDVNAAFAAIRREAAREAVRVRMSHGGSGRQARAVIDGLEADVVTLALGHDIDVLAEAGLVSRPLRGRFPAPPPPLPPTVVFLLRQGEPQGLQGLGGLAPARIAGGPPDPQHPRR